MTALPIALRSNESRFTFAGEAKLINAYAEKQGSDGKGEFALLPSYGMTLERAVTDTPCRGTIFLADLDCAYSVHSTSVYKITETGAATRIGIVPGNDVVELSRNQAELPQISIRCDAGNFYIENDVVTQVTDEDLPDDAISQDQCGGYTVYLFENRKFFISSLNECQTVDGLDFATAEQSADPAVRIKADGDLFIFKKNQTEQWRNTGNPDFPFEPIGTPIRHGIIGPEAVTQFDNTLVFVAEDYVTYRITGTSAVQRISTHAIERAFQEDSDPSAIMAFAFPQEGHNFAVFTAKDSTRVLDAATGFWHTRESYLIGNWRFRFPFKAWGKIIGGDRLTGNLYYLDRTSSVEGTQPLVWGMDTPTFQVFPNGGVIDALSIDVDTGVGLASGQGSDPKLMLSWSVDGGATFRGNRQLSLGTYGKRVRVTTRRLGRFGPKGVIFSLRVSDPVIRALIAMDVQVRPLKR